MTMTLTERLCDAEEKLHQLQTGRLSIEVEVDGRRVRYARTDIDTLQGYVSSLRDLANNVVPRRGAIGFIF